VHRQKYLLYSLFGVFQINKNITVTITYSFPVVKINNEFRYHFFGNSNIIVLYMVTLKLIPK